MNDNNLSYFLWLLGGCKLQSCLTDSVFKLVILRQKDITLNLHFKQILTHALFNMSLPDVNVD